MHLLGNEAEERCNNCDVYELHEKTEQHQIGGGIHPYFS